MNLCLKERKKSVRATQAWVMTSVGLGLHLRLNPKLGAPKRQDSATQSPHSTNWNVFIPCAHTRLTAQVRLLSSRQGKHLPPHKHMCAYANMHTQGQHILCLPSKGGLLSCWLLRTQDCTSQRNTALSGARFPSNPQSPPHYSVSKHNPTRKTNPKQDISWEVTQGPRTPALPAGRLQDRQGQGGDRPRGGQSGGIHSPKPLLSKPCW